MEKKTTIYDVARVAGVSVATVSYVINNAQGHSIREETKNKIWHVVNLLNYKPNAFAKNLRTSTSKLVAVCTECKNYIERAELVVVLERLSESLRNKFDLVFCSSPFGRIPTADAIIVYNMTKESFHEIGKQNYVPLIAVDCLVDDKLFFQVSADYSRLKRQAEDYFSDKFTFVCLKPTDENLKNEISATFENVVFVESSDELRNVSDKNILTTSGLIKEILVGLDKKVLYCDVYSPICRQTADCITNALSRERFDVHSYKV